MCVRVQIWGVSKLFRIAREKSHDSPSYSGDFVCLEMEKVIIVSMKVIIQILQTIKQILEVQHPPVMLSCQKTYIDHCGKINERDFKVNKVYENKNPSPVIFQIN